MVDPSTERVADGQDASIGEDPYREPDGPFVTEPPDPINWNLLTAEEAEVE